MAKLNKTGNSVEKDVQFPIEDGVSVDLEAGLQKAEEESAKSDDIGIEVTATEAKVKPQSSGKKTVKVKLRADHKCHIGGVNYFFERGKTYTVPEAVKFVLNRSDLLSPL